MKKQSDPILVVDDNSLNRQELSRSLEQQGYAVDVARNGVEALELLQKHRFDLVLLDFVMPEMNGYQVLEQIKSDPALRDIPVIMLSSWGESEYVVKCIAIGAEDFLLKPFDPILLKARIGACLEKKHLRDQELEYLQQVSRLTSAAAAVENETFNPDSLTDIVARSDELGQLARVFQHMAREIYTRQQQLKQQVWELRIELDQAKQQQQISKITETEYFRQLQKKAAALRNELRE